MEQIITSKDNKLIKEIKSLHQKKYRLLLEKYFVEGIKMVQEAIDNHQEIDNIIVCQDFLEQASSVEVINKIKDSKLSMVVVSMIVFNEISDTETPQGVLAVIKIKKSETSSDFEKEGLYLLLDGVQDPGNMGTIIRTADAAGVNSIFLSEGCTDIFSPKTLRSTMGSIFRVHLVYDQNLIEIIHKMKEKGIKLVASSLQATENHYDFQYGNKVGLIIGNESNGISSEIDRLADVMIKIPMVGGAESLNVSVAAGILIYEILRKNYTI